MDEVRFVPIRICKLPQTNDQTILEQLGIDHIPVFLAALYTLSLVGGRFIKGGGGGGGGCDGYDLGFSWLVINLVGLNEDS